MEYWSFNTVAIIYITAAGTALLLAFFGWRMRPVRGTVLFSFMMLFIFVWVVSYTLGIYNSNYNLKLFLLRFEYFGMAGAVYLWVFFVARYTQLDKWVNTWLFVILAIIPIFTLVNVLRAPHDTFLHSVYEVEKVKGINVFIKNYTWGFYLWTSYAYSMILSGLIMLTIRITQVSGSTKKQLSFLVPIVFLILAPNMLYISDNNFIEPYDPTPITLVLVGVLFLISIYFYKFLDVVPLAHSLILKNVKSAVIIIDSRAHIIEINKVAEKILGKIESQVLGKLIFKVLPETTDFIKIDSEPNEIKTEKTLGVERRTYEITINPLTDSSENVFGQVIMMWDITEQKMALSELESYARTVAHDLKTPLSHIMGFAKLLVNDVVTEDEKSGYLHNIVTSGEKMKNIIDGLLMLAKIRNIDKIDLTVIDNEAITRSVYQRLEEYIQKNNAEFLLPMKWHAALGNPIWIEEVWINLITNAIKYGGSPPVVEIGSEVDGAYVKYWVKDNGHGLTDEEQNYLFTEFTRIHPKRSEIKGYGLGLSIVERVLRKLSGKVGVESAPGKGSVFYFKLPIAR